MRGAQAAHALPPPLLTLSPLFLASCPSPSEYANVSHIYSYPLFSSPFRCPSGPLWSHSVFPFATCSAAAVKSAT